MKFVTMKKLFCIAAVAIVAFSASETYGAPDSNPYDSGAFDSETYGAPDFNPSDSGAFDSKEMTEHVEPAALDFKTTTSLRRAVDVAFSEIQYSFESIFLQSYDTYSLLVSQSPTPTDAAYPILSDTTDDALNEVVKSGKIYVASFAADWDDALRIRNTSTGLWEDLLVEIMEKISDRYMKDGKMIEIKHVVSESPLSSIELKRAHMTHLYFLLGNFNDKSSAWLGESYDHSIPAVITKPVALISGHEGIEDYGSLLEVLEMSPRKLLVYSDANKKLFAPLFPNDTIFEVLGSEEGVTEKALQMIEDNKALGVISSHLPVSSRFTDFVYIQIPSLAFAHVAWYLKSPEVTNISFFQVGFYILLAVVLITLLILAIHGVLKYFALTKVSHKLPESVSNKIGLSV